VVPHGLPYPAKRQTKAPLKAIGHFRGEERWQRAFTSKRGGALVRLGTEGTQHLYQHAAPNSYEDPRCQETDYPYERIFAVFFPLFPFQRSRDPVVCPDFISLCRCSTSVAAPNTY
jgi:hypothetical protein